MVPGAFLVFDASQFAFSLSANEGDEVYLIETNADGTPARFVDRVEFGASREGESFGRWPDGGKELYPMKQATLGSTNSANGNFPKIGPVVISEIHYNPDGPDLHKEFVAIANTSTTVQDLGNWRVRGEVDFDFPQGTSLAAGATLAIVDFDAATDTESLKAFNTAYPDSGSIALFGPWRDGNDFGVRLSDGGGTIRLEQVGPDISDIGAEVKYAYYLGDIVNYDDESPWPLAADGKGASLRRIHLSAFGDDGTNWLAGIPFQPDETFPPASGGAIKIKGASGGIELGFERIKSTTPVVVVSVDLEQWTPINTLSELSVREVSADVEFVTTFYPAKSEETTLYFRIQPNE